jgi:undecaprenyl-diphosphatase
MTAAAAAAGTYVCAAAALMGAVGRPLALGRTVAVQVAAAFTNRLAPAGIGGMSTNVRYLEASGSPKPVAVAAVGLNSVAGFVVHVVGIVAVVPLLGAGGTHLRFGDPDLPDRWPVLVAIVAVLAAAGLIRWGRRLHRRLADPVRSAGSALVAAMRRPASAAALFAGSAGVTACYALALTASVRAFGVPLGLPAVTATFLGGAAVASLAPTPGGLGALEAALVAGLTSAGAAAAPAVAAVLSFRLITYWIPIVPGAVAFRTLRRDGRV